MSTGNRQVITAPPARPPRYSFLIVAEALNLQGQQLLDVLGHGYRFDPEACGTQRGGVVDIDCGGSTDPMVPGDQAGIVNGDPFVIYAADECSMLGFAGRDWDGRAQRMLAASQSFWFAQEFSEGILDLTQRSLNDAAADDLTPVSGAVDIVQALALIEQGIADRNRGEPGMVHATIGQLTRLIAADALVRDGTIWRTASGNAVVADAGYRGVGPGQRNPEEDGTTWMYGTSNVLYQLGAVDMVPGSFSDAVARAQATDRSVNTVTIYAERAAIWSWDECTHVAVLVAATDSTGGGGGGGGGDASAANQVTEIARLTSIRDSLGTQAGADLTALVGHVDGVEALLTTIDGRVDGLEALVGTTNTTLSTIDGRVDGVETLLTAIDGHVDGLEGSASSLVTALATAPSTFYASGDATNSVKASAGQLLSVLVTNENASVRYLWIANKASAPANADTGPLLVVPIPAGSAAAPTVLALGVDYFTSAGLNCSTGIAIGVSTAKTPFTSATDADHQVAAQYR